MRKHVKAMMVLENSTMADVHTRVSDRTVVHHDFNGLYNNVSIFGELLLSSLVVTVLARFGY